MRIDAGPHDSQQERTENKCSSREGSEAGNPDQARNEPHPVMMLYRCKGCQEEKPLEAYYADKRAKIPCRASSYCIPCHKAKGRAYNAEHYAKYFAENKERLNAKRRTLYQERKALPLPKNLSSMTKVCTRCKIDKPAKEYYWSYRTHNLNSHCKECHKQMTQQWKLSHKQEQVVYARRWRKENPEKYLITQRKFANTKNRKDYLLQHKKNNRDKYNLYSEKRRAVKLDADRGFTPEQWELLKQIYGQLCAYCGKKRKLTMDHVVPLSKGGLHHASNIVPACKTCNSVKHDREAPSYQPILEGVILPWR